jgi:predicted MFS family arabinose efflux permease
MGAVVRTPSRLGRSIWPIVFFLLGFEAMLILITHQYLLPAYDAAAHADQAGRHQLDAVSSLLLMVVLTIIVVGVILVFRVRRYFKTDHDTRAKPTEYSDAWAESGRRSPPPSE